MGASFCTVFEAEVPTRGTLGDDHVALLRHPDELDRFVADHGLTPLGAFESYEAGDFAFEDEEDETPDLPPVRWFGVPDGLAAVDALAARLKEHPDAIPDQAEVLEDLDGLAAELADAGRAGVRFRFAVVS